MDGSEAPAPPASDLSRAVVPLRLIFWGGLLCIFDFSVSSTTNGSGFKFDILNDFVGMLLVVAGVFRLGAIDVARSYGRAMGFVKIVAVVSTIEALADHFVFDAPPAFQALSLTFGLIQLAAILVFCFTMRLFCVVTGLEAPAASWKTTAVLFVVFLTLPVGGFYLVTVVSLLSGSPLNVDLGPVGCVALAFFVIPLVHFFVSTSRMARAAEGAAEAVEDGAP